MILLYLAIIILFGSSIIHLLEYKNVINNINQYEKISLSITFGMIFYSLYLFLLGVLKIKYNALINIPIVIICLLYIIYRIRKKRNFNFSYDFTKIDMFLIFLIIICFLSNYYLMFKSNTFFPDEYSAWLINAKNIFIGKKLNLFINSGLERYPIFLPLLYSGYYIFVNSIDDIFVRIIPSIFLIAILFQFLGLGKKHCIEKKYILISFILVILFYSGFQDYAFSSCADVPFAYFTNFSILYLLEYLLFDKNRTNIFISIVLANGACWTKMEGIAIVFINVIIYLLYFLITRKKDIKFKSIIIYSLSIFVIGIIWQIYIKIMNYPTSLSAGAGSKIEFNIQWLVPLLKSMTDQHFKDYIWSGFTFVFIISLLNNWKKFNNAKKMYIFLGLSYTVAVIIFMIMCYLVLFGYEAVTAASYIRYITRTLFVFIFITLYSCNEEKNEVVKCA